MTLEIKLKLAEKLYAFRKGRANTNGWSSWVETRLGVRQGSISSPILFNVTMNEICNKIREKINGIDLKPFIYADDII
jgi:retron-type reverse transcriptase